MNNDNKKVETLCVQAGYTPEDKSSRIAPLVQSTTYYYDHAADLADAFALKTATPIYTRLGNPTLGVLEEKFAALEGGIAALTTSSGQAAILITLMTLLKSGDHFVAMNNLYGGTYTLFTSEIQRFGIDVTFVDPNASADEIGAAIRENTRLIYGETIGNPGLDVLDFDKITGVAKDFDLPFVVDNTFATPVLCRPIEHGANIVIHSTTKYADGHATCVGGVIVDGGNYNWANGKFPELSTPDESYHGLVYSETFGHAAFILKARAGVLRDIGATMSPFNAWLTNLGMETLHLRIKAHCENAMAVADFLNRHDKIAWVNYPGLKDNPNYERTCKYLPDGASGIVTFGVHGGEEAAKKLIDSVRLATLVTHVCDVRSHLLHPASTTHSQLSDEAKRASGIAPEMIRFSVGIEHVDDIIADLKQALNHI
ncbi:MAG: O-acetylhomoserine aminocarboxypropyltransferase/cysteine synthase [Eubacteriales bacterium]|nr:O-acetylhomoserine aminocarboxypropyltransferase/cysteine synthase [Eubacteriales bacterium]